MADKRTPIINLGDMTPAQAAFLNQKLRGGTRATRRTRKKAATKNRGGAGRRSGAGKRRTRRAVSGGKLKKGSPAAKRRMAQLRAMQRRKRR